jgi:hypothetical protein
MCFKKSFCKTLLKFHSFSSSSQKRVCRLLGIVGTQMIIIEYPIPQKIPNPCKWISSKFYIFSAGKNEKIVLIMLSLLAILVENGR